MHASLTSDAQGSIYKALIRFAGTQKGTFTLAQRDRMKLSELGQSVLADLQPCLISERPIPALVGSKARPRNDIVRRYRVNALSTEILHNAANSLFEWKQPRLPEDLCFYTPKGIRWLDSIAHESIATFDASFIDLDQLIAAVPGLPLERPKR